MCATDKFLKQDPQMVELVESTGWDGSKARPRPQGDILSVAILTILTIHLVVKLMH